MLGRLWRKGYLFALLVGLQIGAATMENSVEVPKKMNTRTIICPSNPIPEYLSKAIPNTNLKRSMHPDGCGSVIYNSQDMEAI